MRWGPEKDFWRFRKVAVTGGTGFLGSHLVAQLCDLEADVVLVVRDDVPLGPVQERWWSKVTRVRGEVRDQYLLERVLGESEVQTVFHLAAQTQVEVANLNPISSFESNIRGTWTVLEAIRHSPWVQQVVVASSDKAYGNHPELPYTETMPLLAVNPYDVSKAAGEMIATSYARTYGVNLAITRCGNLYGPGDANWRRLFPGIIRQLLDGERPIIRSDGTLTRDYLYVEDAASCYLLLAETLAGRPDLAGEAFNFASGRPLSVLEVVALVQAAVGTSLEPDVRATASGEIFRQYLSSEKAREVLGWQPEHSFEEGLDRTVAWYRTALGK
jgi:CDP-glucose 4,6-dehydratase